MSAKQRYQIAQHSQPVVPGTSAFEDLLQPVLHAAREVAGRISPSSKTDALLAMLLRAQMDIISSMRWIYTGATEAEKQSPTRSSGLVADAMLLTRPSLEMCFSGLLLLLDGERYLKVYLRQAWRDACLEVHFMRCRYAKHAKLQADLEAEVEGLRRGAAQLGISEAEANSVLDIFEGEIPTDAEKQRLDEFPLPWSGQTLFSGDPLEPLAREISWDWKLACEAIHCRKRWVLLKASLRRDEGPQLEPAERSELVGRNLPSRSVIVAVVSLLSLTTAISLRFRDDAVLMGSVVKAWNNLSDANDLARRIWHCWAKHNLGVLGE